MGGKDKGLFKNQFIAPLKKMMNNLGFYNKKNSYEARKMIINYQIPISLSMSYLCSWY